MTTKRERDARIEECRKALERFCPPGTTIYTSFQDASRSGMARWYNVHVIHKGEIVRLTGWVADLCGLKYHRKREAIQVNGCGFDGGHDIVHSLSYKLHGMQDVGTDADEQDRRGLAPRTDCYRAGYSLRHRSL